MTLEDSPSLNEFKNGLPDELPKSRGPRKLTRSIIAILGIITLILATANFVRSGTVLAMFKGKGTVTGYVIDETYQPLLVEVYVLGTEIEARSDASGYFEIQGVPAGLQSIAIVTEDTGEEFQVEVFSNSIAGMGEIQLETTDVDES